MQGIPIQKKKKGGNGGKKNANQNKGRNQGFVIEFEEIEEVQPKINNSKDFAFEDLFLSKSNTEITHDEEASLLIDNVIEEQGDDDEKDTSRPLDKEEGTTLFPTNSNTKMEDFQILKLIGKGGYGKVYLVKKKSTGEVFAMKALKKEFLVKTRNVEYTKTERDILTKIRYPFIVSLHYAFQSQQRVYLVMNFLNGGQLLFHLREQAMFSEQIVRFYIAEILLALEHLHGMGIVHRDLKPENILLDQDGHICLTDFGFAKEALTDGRTSTFLGTAEYMAPEIISGQEYGKAVDFWALGILMFDLLTGEPPFRSKSEDVLFQKILKDKVKFPNYLSAECQNLIRGLLNRDVSLRYGSGDDGFKKLKNHPFFKGLNWKKLVNLEIDAPFQPTVTNFEDVSNFDEEYINQQPVESPAGLLTGSQEQLFKGFSWVRPASPLVNSCM